VRDWLSHTDKEAKERRNQRIFDMWLACHTMEAIAGDVNVSKETVSEVCQKMADLPETDKPTAQHPTDFTIPLYNVWKQQDKTRGPRQWIGFCVPKGWKLEAVGGGIAVLSAPISDANPPATLPLKRTWA
jgi:hypothetical protein